MSTPVEEHTPAPGSNGLPDEDTLAQVEAAAVDAATQAGAMVADRFGGMLEVSSKGSVEGKDLVTDVDRASQNIIAEIMHSRFPDHMLLGEEEAPENEPPAKDFIWAVDPIDGTTNFVNNLPMHAVSIGVLHRGRPVAAAVWLPWPSKTGFALLHGHLGGGAWLDGRRLKIEEPEGDATPKPGRLSALPGSLPYAYDIGRPLMSALGEPRVSGSTAYETALVAAGVMQYGISGPAWVWDFAATTLLIREAGGVALALDSNRQWAPLTQWGGPYTNDTETSTRIRRWNGPVISGPPGVASFIAANLRPRQRSLWQRAIRRFKR
ncbi:MAG: inositol monophosphatase [Dehalococcoidia bacterium]